ncbi:MAG: hypothetical protein FWD61_20550 [Phycisphaerales bacterium]|nr:hypothetical protein [Phycisphaerales bacterium]
MIIPRNPNRDTLTAFWQFFLLGELLITLLLVLVLLMAIWEESWGAVDTTVVVPLLFGYLTWESLACRNLRRLRFYFWCCVTAVAILAIFVLYSFLNMGPGGLAALMPVLIGFMLLLFFGVFTMGFTTRLQLLTRESRRGFPVLLKNSDPSESGTVSKPAPNNSSTQEGVK